MTKLLKSNSALSFSFADEMASAMTAQSSVEGRELKLAVAIHNDVASFDVVNIFGTASKRGERIAASLAAHSPAFVAAQATLKGAKGLKGIKLLNAQAAADNARRVSKAATALYERALSIAYMLRACGAVVTHIDKAGRIITFTVHKPVDVEGVKFDAGSTEQLRRKEAHDAGRAIMKARGMIAAKSTAKAGAGVDVKAGISTATIAGELAKAVGALTDKAADEFASSEASHALFVTIGRKLFAHDGVINVSDMIEAFQKAGGINVNIDVKPATIKPQRKAA